MMRQLLGLVALCVAVTVSATCWGLTVPFTEDFATGSENWANAPNTDVLMYSNTGGPDGSGYASGVFNFKSSVPNDGPVVLRATTTPGGASSGGAFFGNWVPGVSTFSYQIRHDAPLPLTFFTRFATPNNFPGAIGLHFAPVLPNTWTVLGTVIDPANPQLIYEGPPFQSVFSNVGNIQVGVSVSAALAGLDQEITFDIDQVTLIPEPTTTALAVFGALSLLATARCRGRQRR